MGLHTYRRDKHQSEISDNKMAREQYKNPSNGNQDNLATSESSSPTTGASGFPNAPEKQDLDLKSYFMIMMEILEKHINNSLKQSEENQKTQLKEL